MEGDYIMWKKGQSGNPGGRKAIPQEILTFLREKSLWAAQKLEEMVLSEKTSEGVKYKCLELILAYGLGKPKQAVDIKGTVEMAEAGSAREEIASAIIRLAAREREEQDPRVLN
jgi:hypothetical protein